MPIPLPAQANLEHLKNQAKQLFKTHRQQQPQALERVAAQSVALPLTLQGAQRVVAREYGFPSWPRLAAFIQALQPHTGFTRRAKRILEQAVAYAKERGDRYIDCPHLLGGMLLDPADKGSVYLIALGLDIERLQRDLNEYRQQVDELFVYGKSGTAGDTQSEQRNLFSDGVKRTLNIAREEAMRLQSPWVDFGHIVLGMLQERKGVGDLLRGQGLSLDQTRRKVQDEFPHRVDWTQ